MLQAMLEAMLQAKEGGGGGDISLSVNDITSRDPDVDVVRSSAVDVGGFGGARRSRRPRKPRKPRQRPTRTTAIEFWHDIFRHINIHAAEPYPWQNSDRKILANAARKYGAAQVMAMWDFYISPENSWTKSTGKTIYGMVRDSARILDQAGFKTLARDYERYLLKRHDRYDAVLNP